jgi:hypothetical protein
MWANDMRSSIRAAYDGLGGVSIDSVECGQTLCRLEIGTNGDDSGRLQAKIGLSRLAITTGERYFGTTASPLPPGLVVYLARENMQLPNRFE